MTTVIESFVARLGWEVDTKQLKTFQSQVKSLGSDLKRAFAGAAVAFGGFAFGVKKVMNAFSMIEDSEAAFTPLLGGLDRAKTLVKELNDLAAATPFEFENLAGSAKLLLPSMQGDIGKTIDLVRVLGDTAGGNAFKMESIVRGFSKVLMKGKADMESLNIISESGGVPIFDQLQKTLGYKSGQAMFDALRQGKIKAEDLTKTFRAMTSEGGIFYKGMEIASQTFSGRMSTLRDEITVTMASVGAAIAPVMKALLEDVIAWVDNLRTWVIANKELVASEFKKFMKDVVELVKDLVGLVSGVKDLIRALGGLRTAIKLVVATWATWKLTAIITNLAGMSSAAILAKGGIDALGASFKSLKFAAGTAGVIAGILAIIDSANSFAKGEGGIIDKYIVDPLLRLSHAYDSLPSQQQWLAKMSGVDLVKKISGTGKDDSIFMVPVNTIRAALKGLWADMTAFGDKINNLILRPVWNFFDNIRILIAKVGELFGVFAAPSGSGAPKSAYQFYNPITGNDTSGGFRKGQWRTPYTPGVMQLMTPNMMGRALPAAPIPPPPPLPPNVNVNSVINVKGDAPRNIGQTVDNAITRAVRKATRNILPGRD